MVRYYAAGPITAKALQQALTALEPALKIDLGELLHGDQSLGQVEVNQAQGDLFEDDLRNTIRIVESTGYGAAIVPRLRASRAVVVADLDWGARGARGDDAARGAAVDRAAPALAGAGPVGWSRRLRRRPAGRRPPRQIVAPAGAMRAGGGGAAPRWGPGRSMASRGLAHKRASCEIFPGGP
jgi:hypothetical protein